MTLWFENENHMPNIGSLIIKNVNNFKNYLCLIDKRFSNSSKYIPCGVGLNNNTLYQHNIWDPHTDQTFTVTQEHFYNESHDEIKRLIFLYWG